jgi:hypothetical protein
MITSLFPRTVTKPSSVEFPPVTMEDSDRKFLEGCRVTAAGIP